MNDANELGVFEAIYSQRQFSRYKPDPVPPEAIDRIIEAATRAPSGGNRQPWEFIAITEPELIRQIGELYSEAWFQFFANSGLNDEQLDSAPPGTHEAVMRQARRLARNMPTVPAMILVCVDHTHGSAPYTPGQPIVRGREGASIWLAVQNLFLAARALGLGTRLTTAHLRREEQIKAVLGIPEYVETVALIPLGYPAGNFGPAVRRPASEVTSYNRYGNRQSAVGNRDLPRNA